MNTTPTGNPLPQRRHVSVIKGLVLLSLGLFVSAVLVVAMAATSFLRLSSDLDHMRNAVIDNSDGGWSRKAQVSVGSLTMGLVRVGMSFAHVEPEAGIAVQALRGADVAVYERSGARKTGADPEILRSADGALLERGWCRMVGVMEDDTTVGVYVPTGKISENNVPCCVVVETDNNLVFVWARADLEPLLKLAIEKGGLKRKIHALAGL